MMRRVNGDYWKLLEQADAICFTSNCVLKKNGELVMGAGIAKAFKEQFPALPKFYGEKIKEDEQGVFPYKHGDLYIFNFPTKYHWKDKSSLKLIERSARKIEEEAKALNLNDVLMPAPGCSLGGLTKKEVLPVLESNLSDRFIVLI